MAYYDAAFGGKCVLGNYSFNATLCDFDNPAFLASRAVQTPSALRPTACRQACRTCVTTLPNFLCRDCGSR